MLSAKGKKPSEREHAAGRVVAGLARLVDREERAVHPAHLAGADADRRLVAREQDGVGLDRRHRGPGEPEVVPLPLGRLPVGGDGPVAGPTASNWNWSWTRKPPRTRLKSSVPVPAAHRQLDHPERLLGGEHGQRLVVERRRHDDLDEQVAHRLRRGAIHHGVERRSPSRRRRPGRSRGPCGMPRRPSPPPRCRTAWCA